MTAADWALVTGASAGIGAEFCRQLAADGYNLVLVSRTAADLAQRAEEIRKATPAIEVEVLAADLSTPTGVDAVAARLRSDDGPISVLVNNAGHGVNQRFATGDLAREQAMLDVLVTAPMRLTHAVLPGMKLRGRGEIVLVASVAAFIAGGTYSAAKSWGLVFSEGLNQELQGTGVRVSALCPGFTHTEFHDRAGMNKGEIPGLLWLSAERVVREGWRGHLAGKAVVVPAKRYRALVWLSRHAPRPLVRSIGFNSRNRSRR